MNKPYKKYFKKKRSPDEHAHFRRQKRTGQATEESIWEPAIREISYYCGISSVRDYGVEYLKTESGTPVMELNFYRLKKLLSQDALEIFDSELSDRIEKIGFSKIDSRYHKSGFRITIGLAYGRDGRTAVSETQKMRVASLETAIDENNKKHERKKGILSHITKKVASLFKKNRI